MLSNMRPEVLDQLARQQKNKPLQEAVQAELAQRLLTRSASMILPDEATPAVEAGE